VKRTPQEQRTYERKKAWRRANPEKAKASVEKFMGKHPHNKKNFHLRRKYGISLQDIYDVVELQGGCAVCHSPTPRKVSRTGGPGEWTVDHDHETGKVRGIVCHPCNTALGMADDSAERLRALADYLEKNK
jgi:hypothetical protein